jgi:2-polyprenyl-3-methyl-5-hydroxy-6-metoxy-1,4-benzoquinol methylase
MGEAGVTDEFFARRAAARARLDGIDPHKKPGGVEADPQRKDWFEAVYRLAEGDAAGVPWAHLAPHPLLAEWLAGRSLEGQRTLDIGCGLGDNAEALAAAGARVTAFDLIEEAIAWAKRRFPQSAVDYRAADLFAPPPEWRGGFDLVHECYTLQALPDSLLDEAAQALTALVAPGGLLLVIARARDEGQEVAGPPWPLPPSRIAALAAGGLRPEMVEDISASDVMVRHWRAAFRRDS